MKKIKKIRKMSKKSYYFFATYQVYSKEGLLIMTGDTLQRIDTGVMDGPYEHFGLKELRESLLEQAREKDKRIKEDAHVILTSFSELSQDLWHQLNGPDDEEEEESEK